MSSNDSSSDLDSRISAIVESTVGRMREELLHRMQETEERLRGITGRLPGEPAAEVASEPAAAPAAAPAAPSDAGEDLFEAVVAIDRGTSQQEVLAALLEGVGRFASRTALFLTRADAAQGWGSYGFGDGGAMQQVTLSYGEGPLAALAEGRGCVVLTADDCADLCRQMGAEPGAEGLLVPFVLRDRLAAALYVDRFAEDPPLARRSLQLLAYVGAQAVEGLALRQRAETPTLKIASEDAAAPGVALWEAPAAEAAPQVAATETPEPEITEPEITEAEITELEIAEPETAEPETTEPAAVAPEPVPEPPAEPEPAPEDLLTEVTLDEIGEEEAPAGLASEAAAERAPSVEEDWQLPDLSTEEPAAAPAPETEAPPEPPAEESRPWAATDGDLSAVETEPAPEPPGVAPPTEAPDAAAGETTEVRPPTDVSGPGWAFTASRAAADAGDEAQHEEARRLARLLVTEIKLYNEEQVEEGRRGNDIYARLREDIDRSRQIFNERVDEAVRQENDYFHEEMVRILGGGNAEALGI